MRRLPVEYLILASLAGSLAFLAYVAIDGSIQLEGNRLIAVSLLTVIAGIGLLALWFVVLRKIAGAVLAAIFYGVQTISVLLASGTKIGVNSLPTLYFRVHGDKEHPTNLNVVSFVLFILSLVLLVTYREQQNRTR